MAEEKDARYQFRLPQSLLDAALDKARRQDLSLSQVLRRLIREWVEDPPEPEQEGQEP